MKIKLNQIKRVKTLSQYVEIDQELIEKMAYDIDSREINLLTISQRNKKRKRRFFMGTGVST